MLTRCFGDTLSVNPIYSTSRDLISHRVERESEHNYRVVFDYPDCTRTFDGRQWTVQDKPQPTNLFTNPQ